MGNHGRREHRARPRSNHVLVAPDTFKGSLSAARVATAIAAGLRCARPDVAVRTVPLADGGEGTIDAVLAAGFVPVPVVVTGPTGRPVNARFARRGTTAVVELAEASGLHLLPAGRLKPLEATSRGTGELITAALGAGCRRLVLAVGGSACSDGGVGMVQALGVRVLDRQDRELSFGGGALDRLHRIVLDDLDPRLAEVEITLASDVDNPLVGPQGAAAVYAPQKGASPADVAVLEKGLARWAAAVNPQAAHWAGAGAAGGVGFAALSILHARCRPGIELIFELVGFHRSLTDCALVITGEGALDAQTLRGKAPFGVAAAAQRAGVPVVAVCGRRALEASATPFSAIYSLGEIEPDLDRCIADPEPLLVRIGAHIASAWVAP